MSAAIESPTILNMGLELLEQISPDIPVSNCADCGELLIAKPVLEMVEQTFPYKMVAGRILGRPYCRRCLSTSRRY